MKKNLLKSTLCLFIALGLNAQETYSVDQLIVKALENSPDLKISSANYEASQERLKISESDYLPNLNLHLGAGKQGMSDITANPDEMLEDDLLLGQLSVQQIIYDFGKTSGNVKSYEYDSQATLMDKEQKISNKIRDVKRAYFDVLQAIAIIKVHKENVRLNEAQLYRSKKYFEAGIRTKIDVSDAKVALIQSQLDLKKSEYDLQLAYTQLDNVVGFMDLTTSYSVYAKDLELKSLYKNLKDYPLNLEESLNFAYQNRYELKKYQADIKSSEAKQTLATSQFYPSIYFDADYTKQKTENFVNIPEDQWQASLNLDWNLYEGGASSADAQEKLIQVGISKSELLNTKLSIKSRTTRAYINLSKMKDSVNLSQSLLEVSKEKFEQAGKRYEFGLSDYIELQESRQGYIDAMASLVVNYYNYYKAIANLDNAIGK